MKDEVIVIGAGAAGLMAACELAEARYRVIILEARDRIGGRIQSWTDPDGKIIECGAEFVHGRLPLTTRLLDEAGLNKKESGGEWIELRSGHAEKSDDGKEWRVLLNKLHSLEEDMSLQEFLEKYFPEDKYALLKDRAVSFAEGYDAADASKVSAKALYEEWTQEDEEQNRVEQGYSALMNFLAERVRSYGGRILLNQPVSYILAGANDVTVIASKQFSAGRVVMAVPLGVLQNESIEIANASAAFKESIQGMGFGDVIKFLFRFDEAFWEEQYPELGFLFSRAPVPTWWTQAPSKSTLLTGWLAGRGARACSHLSQNQLLEMGLHSLAQIFSRDVAAIQDRLRETRVMNWSADPFTMGAYTYARPSSALAQKFLSKPLEGRIYFAGDFMYEGAAMGTVEAALSSGEEVARRIILG
jgi:monoamine oxidase